MNLQHVKQMWLCRAEAEYIRCMWQYNATKSQVPYKLTCYLPAIRALRDALRHPNPIDVLGDHINLYFVPGMSRASLEFLFNYPGEVSYGTKRKYLEYLSWLLDNSY